MTRPHRQPAVTEFRQKLSDRSFMQRDAETALQLSAQIDTPPTHNLMDRRIGARLDQPDQFSLLFGSEPR